MPHSRLRFILPIILALTLGAVGAADKEVSTTGSDVAGCGAAASPCRSIQFCANQLNGAGGDRCRVHTGTYLTTAGPIINVGGSAGNPNTITPFGDGPVVWDASTPLTSNLVRIGANDIKFDGGSSATSTFTIRHSMRFIDAPEVGSRTEVTRTILQCPGIGDSTISNYGHFFGEYLGTGVNAYRDDILIHDNIFDSYSATSACPTITAGNGVSLMHMYSSRRLKLYQNDVKVTTAVNAPNSKVMQGFGLKVCNQNADIYDNYIRVSGGGTVGSMFWDHDNPSDGSFASCPGLAGLNTYRNNVVDVQAGGSVQVGMHSEQSGANGGSSRWYNNTLSGVSVMFMSDPDDALGATAIQVMNNIHLNGTSFHQDWEDNEGIATASTYVGNQIYFPDAVAGSEYRNCTGIFVCTNYTTYAAWFAAVTPDDGSSTVADPGLNATTFIPTSSGSAAATGGRGGAFPTYRGAYAHTDTTLKGCSFNTSCNASAAPVNTTPIPIIACEAGNPSTQCMTPTQNYQGAQGGRYPGGVNTPPAAHAAALAAAVATIKPLNTAGVEDLTGGRIIMTVIGLSNTTQVACGKTGAYTVCDGHTVGGLLAADPSVNPRFTYLNCAASGRETECWDEPTCIGTAQSPCVTLCETDPNHNQYDRCRDSGLTPIGATEAQVQILYILENTGPVCDGTGGLCTNTQPATACTTDAQCAAVPGSTCSCEIIDRTPRMPEAASDMLHLEDQYGDEIRAARARWPNLKLVLISPRAYGGFGASPQGNANPETYAYESAFSTKNIIEDQINQCSNNTWPNPCTGPVDTVGGDLSYASKPVLKWGPYLWATTTPNAEGLSYVSTDFQRGNNQGQHPTVAGETKEAAKIVADLKADPYVTPWLLGSTPSACGDGTVNTSSEQCDGADLDGLTCADFRYSGGTLGCTASCQFTVAACTGSLPFAYSACKVDNGNESCIQDPYIDAVLIQADWDEFQPTSSAEALDAAFETAIANAWAENKYSILQLNFAPRDECTVASGNCGQTTKPTWSSCLTVSDSDTNVYPVFWNAACKADIRNAMSKMFTKYATDVRVIAFMNTGASAVNPYSPAGEHTDSLVDNFSALTGADDWDTGCSCCTFAGIGSRGDACTAANGQKGCTAFAEMLDYNAENATKPIIYITRNPIEETIGSPTCTSEWESNVASHPSIGSINNGLTSPANLDDIIARFSALQAATPGRIVGWLGITANDTAFDNCTECIGGTRAGRSCGNPVNCPGGACGTGPCSPVCTGSGICPEQLVLALQTAIDGLDERYILFTFANSTWSQQGATIGPFLEDALHPSEPALQGAGCTGCGVQ